MKKIILSLLCFCCTGFFASSVYAYCSSLNPATYYACQQRENQHNQMMQMQQQQMLMQQQYMNQQIQFQQQQQEYQQKVLDIQNKYMQQPVYIPQYNQGNNEYCTGALEFDYFDYMRKVGSGRAKYMTKEEFAHECNSVYDWQYNKRNNSKYCTGSLEFDYYNYMSKTSRAYMSKEEFAKACHYNY